MLETTSDAMMTNEVKSVKVKEVKAQTICNKNVFTMIFWEIPIVLNHRLKHVK